MGKGIYALVAIIRTGGKVNRMSDDLISREAVFDILFEARIRDTLLASPTFIETLRQRVKELPVAFDKEKVIEELQRPDPIIRTFVGKGFTTIDKAIEIVKKGGIG